MQLILASASIGRKNLLERLQIPFDMIPSTVKEEKIIGKTPLQTLKLRAKAKGEKVVSSIKSNFPSTHNQQHTTNNSKPTTYLILSADSGAILGPRLIGKPKNYKEAEKILKSLSGKTHKFVTTLYYIKIQSNISKVKLKQQKSASLSGLNLTKVKKVWEEHEVTSVTFRKLSKVDIKHFLSTLNYTRYAASYAIASAQNFITKIDGSISNVIGLPLEKVIPVFRKNNILS